MMVYVTYNAPEHGIRRGILKGETTRPPGGYVLLRNETKTQWFLKNIFSPATDARSIMPKNN